MLFNPGAFIDNLKYLGLGMLGVFAVTAVIIGITYLLMLIFRKKKNSDNTN